MKKFNRREEETLFVSHKAKISSYKYILAKESLIYIEERLEKVAMTQKTRDDLNTHLTKIRAYLSAH